MSFWDSSAVIPLLLVESSSQRLLQLHRAERELTVWWATPIECASAIARREDANLMTSDAADVALTNLRNLSAGWDEILPSDRLRDLAVRLLRTHSLHAADALQLAAALVASEEEPATLAFVCLDDRLALAAQREGFAVAP